MLAALLALQSTLAAPVDPAPLVAGRWVFRETREFGTGARAVSATLLARDGTSRLVVRCDLSYQRDISIQFLSTKPGNPVVTPPAKLGWAGAAKAFPLRWEQGPIGIFARNGRKKQPATAVVEAMRGSPGLLAMRSSNRVKGAVAVEFDNREDRDQLRRVLAACAPPGSGAAAS